MMIGILSYYYNLENKTSLYLSSQVAQFFLILTSIFKPKVHRNRREIANETMSLVLSSNKSKEKSTLNRRPRVRSPEPKIVLGCVSSVKKGTRSSLSQSALQLVWRWGVITWGNDRTAVPVLLVWAKKGLNGRKGPGNAPADELRSCGGEALRRAKDDKMMKKSSVSRKGNTPLEKGDNPANPLEKEG